MIPMSCPTPVSQYDHVVIGHGSGGQMTDDLVQHIFAPAFEMAGVLGDGAVLEGFGPDKLVVSTDSFVVQPLFFPGGDIGHLAVTGTVNDLAMMGAIPLYLTVGFVLEEGLSFALLKQVVASMAQCAKEAGVSIVAGDTKVIERGRLDGLYINTTGVGRLHQQGPHAARAKVGDAVLVNGSLGDHGIAIMGARHGLDLNGEVVSDAAPLNGLVAAMQATGADIHVLRDLTRGGLAAALNEIARASQVSVVLDEPSIPVQDAVGAACEVLGYDVLHVANEGKLVAIVGDDDAERVLKAMRAHPLGKEAACIGTVSDDNPGLVMGYTAYGSTRVIDMPVGELLPRIC